MNEQDRNELLQIIGALTVDTIRQRGQILQLQQNLEHSEQALKLVLAAKQPDTAPQGQPTEPPKG